MQSTLGHGNIATMSGYLRARPNTSAARTWIREYFFDEEPGKRKHPPAVIGPQPCFFVRLGGMSGGRVTQRCLESSHTEIVGPGKFGSAKVPMATAT